MSPIAALRSRRSSLDLPPDVSDEELLAWSSAMVSAAGTLDEDEPVAAAPRRRSAPLRAPKRVVVHSTSMTTDELLDEIARRAMRAAGMPRTPAPTRSRG